MKSNYLTSGIILVTGLAFLTACQKENVELGNNADHYSTNSTATTTQQTVQATNTATVLYKGVDLTISSGKIENYQLKFTVTNLGGMSSPACKAAVWYRCNNNARAVFVSVPSIAGAGTFANWVNLTVPVEAICFESDIQFQITVDYYNTVAETNENNNTYSDTRIN